MAKLRTPQAERRAAAQTALLDATVKLIAERGPGGFSLADVGQRAGVSRGLAIHHFSSREALLEAAVARLAAQLPSAPDDGHGLPGLRAWIEQELGQAERHAPEICVFLQLAMVPAAGSLGFVAAKWVEHQVAYVRERLERARLLEQVRDDLEPETTAPVLVGLLTGEFLRLLRGGARSGVFLELVDHAVGQQSGDASRGRRAARPQGKQGIGQQTDLF